MRRRMVLMQLAVFAVISVVIISYTMFNLLGVRVVNGPFRVTVHLKTAGGIFQGAEVAYRGVAVGRVQTVHLETSGVTLSLSIDHGQRIPDNAIAHIYDLSAVGEQYVDLVPTRSSTSYLHKGSVIPADRTTTPLQTATVLYDLERFVDSINPTDVQIIGTEGAAAFTDTGPQLKSILADATSIIDQLSQSQNAAVDLINNSAVLLHGAAAHSSDFDLFATSLNQLTATLASSTPTIETFIQQAQPTTQLVNTLITTNATAVGVLLANLAVLSDIQVARIPGLRSLLVAVPQFGATAPKLVHDGALDGGANFNYNQPVCPTGIPISNPLSGKRTPLASANCDQSLLIRGANAAPRPGGVSAQSAQSAQSAPLDASSQSLQVGGYDPSTGFAQASDGSMIRLGTNGGQDELMGANSWQALLMAVTGG